jgi:SpoVK/Ycf46/Vps4 family AAA+-type ATPase
MPAYRTSREHLFEELRRLDLVLNERITRQRSEPGAPRFNDFRGLFIAEDEIAQLVDENSAAPLFDEQTSEKLGAFAAAIAEAEKAITNNVSESLKQGVYLSLQRLAEVFQLSPFDVDALLICLAPELDLKYEKLYAYLQNDVTRKRPTTDLILSLFCRSLEEKLQARARLLPAAPLFKYELIMPASEANTDQSSLLARALKIDERILNYLLDADVIDADIASFARVVQPQVVLDDVILPQAIKQNLVAAFQRERMRELDDERHGKVSGAAVFILEGPEGSGKKLVAEALCQATGRELLVAEATSFMAAGPGQESRLARLFREARLRDGVVFIDQAEALRGEDKSDSQGQQLLAGALRGFNGIVLAGSCDSWSSQFRHERFFRFTFPIPDFSIRRQIWQRTLGQCAGVSPDVDLDSLADRFNFTPGRVWRAVAEAKRLAGGGDPTRAVEGKDLNQACRAQTGDRLLTIARKINPIFDWNDIILPNDCLAQLQEVCAQVSHRQRVFSEWGFDRKVSLGRGLGILFAGPSGTGKTMAAEIIAHELALDLYKIDLSGLVSKYIGETEKNLSRVFAEAEQSNAVLFFDEADAIFGKRSEVKDSHDRYANIEINYLLQKMEEHEGIVILASNFQRNIDEAFTRRLRFIIEFPFPERDYRYRIWQKVFPANTPTADDIDFDFLAHKLKFSGGSIRNVALSAAFLAAGNSGHVRMEHIVCAARREFQKMGRLCVKSDFEQYFELLATDEVAS